MSDVITLELSLEEAKALHRALRRSYTALRTAQGDTFGLIEVSGACNAITSEISIGAEIAADLYTRIGMFEATHPTKGATS